MNVSAAVSRTINAMAHAAAIQTDVQGLWRHYFNIWRVGKVPMVMKSDRPLEDWGFIAYRTERALMKYAPEIGTIVPRLASVLKWIATR